MYSLLYRQSDSFSNLLSCNNIDSFLNALSFRFPLLSSDELNNVRLFCETSCPGCVYVFPFSGFDYRIAVN